MQTATYNPPATAAQPAPNNGTPLPKRLAYTLHSIAGVPGGVETFIGVSAALILLLIGAKLRGPLLFNQNVSLASYLVVFGAVALRFTRVMRGALKSPLLMSFILLTIVSTKWSVVGTLSLRKSIALAITGLMGVYIGSVFTTKQMIFLLRVVCCVVLFVCLVSLVFSGGAFHEINNKYSAFRGAFEHKNQLGRFLAFSAILVCIGANRNAHTRVLRACALVMIGLVLLLTRSATADAVTALMFVIIVFVAPMLRAKGNSFFAGMAILVLAAMAGAFVVAADDLVPTQVLGRDATLTGRTQLWHAVEDAISRRPLLGYGFAGFWDTASPYSLEVQNRVHWKVKHSHNGFLELTLDVGIIGTSLFILIILQHLVRAFRLLRSSADPYAAWPLAYLVFTIAYNLTETTTVRVATLYWIVFVAVCTSLARQESTARQQFEIQIHGLEPGQQVSIVAA